MAEQMTKVGGPGADETEKSRSIITYIIGVIILFIIGFLIYKGILTVRKNISQTATAPAAPVSVTMEATVEQILSNENTFYIKSLAGYTTLTFTPQTEFVLENGKKANSYGVKVGDKIRAEGKPNGKIFEAKKVTILGANAVLPKVTGKAAIPTPYKLPGTGILD